MVVELFYYIIHSLRVVIMRGMLKAKAVSEDYKRKYKTFQIN